MRDRPETKGKLLLQKQSFPPKLLWIVIYFVILESVVLPPLKYFCPQPYHGRPMFIIVTALMWGLKLSFL